MKIKKELIVTLELEDVQDMIYNELLEQDYLQPDEQITIEEMDIGEYVVKVIDQRPQNEMGP